MNYDFVPTVIANLKARNLFTFYYCGLKVALSFCDKDKKELEKKSIKRILHFI